MILRDSTGLYSGKGQAGAEGLKMAYQVQAAAPRPPGGKGGRVLPVGPIWQHRCPTLARLLTDFSIGGVVCLAEHSGSIAALASYTHTKDFQRGGGKRHPAAIEAPE